MVYNNSKEGFEMDRISKKKRSYIMSRIRGKNTYPERRLNMALVRKGINGFKRNSDDYGRPDFVFKREKLVVFVDGEFWHGKGGYKYKSGFWKSKIRRNIERDREVNRYYRKLGFGLIRVSDKDVIGRLDYCIHAIMKILGRGLKNE